MKTKAGQIDEEISRVIEEAHQRVRGILSAHRNVLDDLAHLLSQEEIVQGETLRKMLAKPCGDFTGAAGIVKVYQPNVEVPPNIEAKQIVSYFSTVLSY